MVGVTADSRKLSNTLKTFWELESIGVQEGTTMSPNVDIRQKFEGNIETKNCHYEVGLPRKYEVDLANNKEVATKRLQQLTKKLVSDTVLIHTYDHAIRQFLSDGYAKVINTAENGGSYLVYYLPHGAMV